METKRSKLASLQLWATVAALLSQSLVLPVMCSATVEDQKNYYPPDPNARSPPTGSHQTPSHGSGGGHGSSTPSHGTPSHGGGSSGGTPPANCGNPPSGGHYNPTPSPPTGGGGGGYYHSPPSSGGGTPPTPTIVSPPVSVSPPTIESPPVSVSPPTIVSPPTSPIDPGTPSIPVPPFGPNSPPFTCDYWRTHPLLIWGLLGWWGTVGTAFGATSFPGVGANMSLQQALSNTRTDGLGALYREGTASFLNSMAHNRFPYTTKQVRDRFVAALRSNGAAAAQAQLFKLANEGRIPRA